MNTQRAMEQGTLRRILQAFTWWHGTTWGTSWTTFLRGEYVGSDSAGNRYYRTRKGRKDPALGRERRWVIYSGEAEASTIPPGRGPSSSSLLLNISRTCSSSKCIALQI